MEFFFNNPYACSLVTLNRADPYTTITAQSIATVTEIEAKHNERNKQFIENAPILVSIVVIVIILIKMNVLVYVIIFICWHLMFSLQFGTQKKMFFFNQRNIE